MSIKTLTFQIRGVTPILFHNGQTADPLNEWTKRIKSISGKRKKTDADLEKMAEYEWKAGLYVSSGQVAVSANMIHGMLIEAAKKEKKGPLAKAGIWFTQDFFPLTYEGPREIDELWQDERFRLTVGVRVQKNRIMRTRPKFDHWELEFSCDTDDTQINKSDVEGMLEIGGQMVGLGDWRPRYGRFELVK